MKERHVCSRCGSKRSVKLMRTRKAPKHYTKYYFSRDFDTTRFGHQRWYCKSCPEISFDHGGDRKPI